MGIAVVVMVEDYDGHRRWRKGEASVTVVVVVIGAASRMTKGGKGDSNRSW